MKRVIFGFGILLRLNSFAYGDCQRVLGTPGFLVTGATEAQARQKAQLACGVYQAQNQVGGQCSFLGCQQNSAEFTCRVEIVECHQ